MAEKSAEKSVEELVKEMSKLEEQVSQLQLVKEKLEMQLEDANKQAKAVDYIKQLADNYNVEYDANEISGDYWENLLTAVLFEINQQTEEDLESLCVDAEQRLAKDANLIAMKDEEIASLQQQITTLEKTVNQKDNDVNRLKKKEAQLSEVKQKLVDVKNSRTAINKNYKKLSKEKAKADKVLESLQVVIDETLTPEGVYANVVAMIIEKFQDAGYKVSPFNASESNSKENNREYELYKAVKKAKKSDKKAEKLAKDGEVSYSPSGYKTIEEDIINAYTQMKNAYAKAGVSVVDAFESKYSSDQDRQDGKVTSQEIIETIIDKEQSKGGFAGFIKTTQGKILTLAAVVVVATGVAFGGTQGYQAYQANQELYQTTVTLDQTQAELDSVEGERDSAISDKEQAETDKTQAEQERDEAKEQLNAKEEELQDYIEGFISGDIVTLDTTSQQFVQEFQTYETYLERITADDVRGIQSCQYNKETGDVSILLNCKTSDGSEVATHITFTMDMSNISQAISEGKSILDLSTIIEAMKTSASKNPFAVSKQTYTNVAGNEAGDDANESMSGTNGETVNVYTTFTTTKNAQSLIVVCHVMVVSVDENGKETVTTYTSNENIFPSTVNVEKAQQKVRDNYLQELGLSYEEEELVIE